MKAIVSGLCLVVILAVTGCMTTKDDRGNLFRTAAKASGNPFAQIAVDALYGSGDVQDYRLPEGLGIAAHPVDSEGNWIQGVAGYAWYLYPLDGQAMPTFSPAAFMPMNKSVPIPRGGAPMPLRPALRPEPIRPQYEDLINEATEATTGRL